MMDITLWSSESEQRRRGLIILYARVAPLMSSPIVSPNDVIYARVATINRGVFCSSHTHRILTSAFATRYGLSRHTLLRCVCVCSLCVIMSSYQRKLFAKRAGGKSRRKEARPTPYSKRQRLPAPAVARQPYGVQPETKHLDDGIDLQADGNVWMWDPLTCASIRSRLANNERTGSQVQVTRVSFRGAYYQDNAKTTGQCERVRVALFVDNQNSGANPVYTTWFQMNDIDSFRSSTGPQRGVILHDESFVMQPSIAGADNLPYHNVQFSVRCNVLLTYVADTGAVTDLRGNQIFVGICAVNKAGESEGVLTGQLRLAFRNPS